MDEGLSTVGTMRYRPAVSWERPLRQEYLMIFSFILFLVLFLGGIWVMGLAQTIEDFQAIVFCAGLLLSTGSLGYVMRQPGSATRRSGSWSGKATE